MHPYYVIRAVGGLLFIVGALIMVYNLWMTVRGAVEEEPVSGTETDAARPVPAE
jgi:cytochrome c oxidase cbb3-type subunit 1